MKQLFGTDGMRAVAGEYPLDRPRSISWAGPWSGCCARKACRPRFSSAATPANPGEWIEADFVRGIADAGGTGHCAGVIPTSGVAYLTKTNAFSAGAVISASHNPYRDNGIKIFSHLGFKIPDEWEERWRAPPAGAPARKRPPADGGRAAGRAA